MEMLSSKIRINACSKRTSTSSKKHIYFYRKYASFVTKALKKPLFQRFLRWLLRREKIDASMVKEIQVRVFPLEKENGNSLAGRWNSRGEIHIYPRRLETFRDLAVEHGSEAARSYVKCRALAALIHEILHSKYSSNEEKVRRLTKRYFNIYIRSSKTQHLNKNTVLEMLFKQ